MTGRAAPAMVSDLNRIAQGIRLQQILKSGAPPATA
jgi:hypothetical protein